MGKLIGEKEHRNSGEDLFAKKAQEYFDDSTIIYWNRQVFGREFDFCILLPNKGILVVELKGWKEDNILRVDNNEFVVVNSSDGEVRSNPQKQARGYRFSIERLIKNSTGKFPLVYQMVCLPQVSKSFFSAKRLDVVMEERFTILKDDLKNNTVFNQKLDQALREVNNWNRDIFDRHLMNEVRCLFEADFEDTMADAPYQGSDSLTQHDYSRFYFFDGKHVIDESVVSEIAAQYLMGCKMYCVFSNKDQMKEVIHGIDCSLFERGLVRKGNGLDIQFETCDEPLSEISSSDFSGFNLSFCTKTDGSCEGLQSFCVKNGEYDADQKTSLKLLGQNSTFNYEQYLIEHESPEKNIVVRAGAGTGKTHTMISRIGFICYSQKVPLSKMSERIVMITFTNEAADQMEEKLKDYFKNCYLLTSNVEYLDMISKIDHMQISTIHSYAKHIISKLGTAFGYGIDVGITSSEYSRRKKISEILDYYIKQKMLEQGNDYPQRLGMPVYAIRDSILAFIEKLHNKSVDINSIVPEDFGSIEDGSDLQELHELFSVVIPEVERTYSEELLQNNRIHLSSLMSTLSKFICSPECRERIIDLKHDKDAHQFMFVDEFQDTDDTQIEVLLTIAQLLDYRLFLVGDIKQCIYRFRGAQEKAFDQLRIEENSSSWADYTLHKNYRTDKHLLDLFDMSFSKWGQGPEELLSYSGSDKLYGLKNYNEYIQDKSRYYKCITVESEDQVFSSVADEIKRLQRRIQYEDATGRNPSSKAKSIAILVRENWQAERIRKKCEALLPGITIQTNTGGDLYRSQPALDMLTLVNALVHFDEAEYLYSLATSNFFDLDIPRSNLYEQRKRIKANGWKAKADEKEQANFLIKKMNALLVNMDDKTNTWESVVAGLRVNPVLQVIRLLYNHLEPWNKYSMDEWNQHYYQLNVDLLFEQLINACNVDRLTINTLQEHLFNCIVAQLPVDSRIPSTEKKTSVSVFCITVHKAKGLEYGHVILPYCYAPIDTVKQSHLNISTLPEEDRIRIGYSLSLSDNGRPFHNDYYDFDMEKAEKCREETRILYVAMTRAMCSFSWIRLAGRREQSWQNLIEVEE